MTLWYLKNLTTQGITSSFSPIQSPSVILTLKIASSFSYLPSSKRQGYLRIFLLPHIFKTLIHCQSSSIRFNVFQPYLPRSFFSPFLHSLLFLQKYPTHLANDILLLKGVLKIHTHHHTHLDCFSIVHSLTFYLFLVLLFPSTTK